MKKIFVLACAAFLSSCAIHAGEHRFLEERDSWFFEQGSYAIDFFYQEPKLLKTEYITEDSRRKGLMTSAYAGKSMLSQKTYAKKYTIKNEVEAVMKGSLGGEGIAVDFYKGDKLPIIGQVQVNGEDFVLIPADTGNEYVFLVRRDGSVYNRSGVIRNNRLVLLLDDVNPKPYDFRFKPTETSAVETTKPVAGFDLQYEGIKNGQMVMTYFVFNPQDSSNGTFETLAFPAKVGVYRINDIKLKVVNVSPAKIDYIVMDI